MTLSTTLSAAEVDPTLADGAFGSDNPILAFNLGGTSYYDTGQQFLNLLEVGEWLGHLPGQWGGMTETQLENKGYLVEDGLVEMPEGFAGVGMMWSWKAGYEGTYVLRYEGEGKVDISGNVNIISKKPGEIVFEKLPGDNLYFGILSTDPNDNGNYIRNMSIVAEEYVEAYDMGATYNPEWIAKIADSSQIRFMNWMETNNSKVVSWEDYTGRPVEQMVQLANEIGADPWFTMPHQADADFIRQFATYVRDNLDPDLQVRVEYSNEVWNSAFEQYSWLANQSKAEWGDYGNDYQQTMAYHLKKAVETAQIWEEVFGEEADARLVNVLGGQGGNWSTKELITGNLWQQLDGENFVDPTTVFEEFAITTYFGSQTVSSEDLREELIQMIKDPEVNARKWYFDKLMDPTYPGSVVGEAGRLERLSDLIESYGMKMVGYEGGQHVHHSFAVSGLTGEDLKILTNFMTGFVRSPLMAELYEVMWEAWSSFADNPYMQYGDVEAPSQYGSWGLYKNLDDSTPRSELLEDLSENTDGWWREGGSQYQNGVITVGTEEDEILVGTLQEDYLVGRGGDDTFVLGLGDDGAHGGAGFDTVVMRGTAQEYIITREGDGWRVDGPEGSDLLIDIENIRFEDDTVIDLRTYDPEAAAAAKAKAEAEAKAAAEAEAAAKAEAEAEAAKSSTSGSEGLDDTSGSHDDSLLSPPESEASKAIAEAPLASPLIALGQQLDATGLDAVQTLRPDSGWGLEITAINQWSGLGRELGYEETVRAYTISDKAMKLTVDGIDIKPNYTVLEEGRLNLNSGLMGESVLDVTLRLASVVTNVEGIIVGSTGNDTFTGRNAKDVFYGGDGNDKMNSSGGNDTLYGGAGDDRLDGGDGWDIALFSGNSDDYHLHFGGSDIVIEGTDGRDTLTGVEVLQFENGDRFFMQKMSLLGQTDLALADHTPTQFADADGLFLV